MEQSLVSRVTQNQLNMNNKFFAAAFLIGGMLFASCSPKIPFTQSVRDQYKLSPAELQKIQFYTSDPIVLRKGTAAEREKTTEDGKLIIKSGKSIQQVIIKAKTPGAVDQVVDVNSFKVAFEDGAEKSFVFSSSGDRNGYYRIVPASREGGKLKINYGGDSYYAVDGSEGAVLLFKMKSLKELKVVEKVAKGKKVN